MLHTCTCTGISNPIYWYMTCPDNISISSADLQKSLCHPVVFSPMWSFLWEHLPGQPLLLYQHAEGTLSCSISPSCCELLPTRGSRVWITPQKLDMLERRVLCCIMHNRTCRESYRRLPAKGSYLTYWNGTEF